MTPTSNRTLPPDAKILTAVEMNNIHLPMSGTMPPREPTAQPQRPAIAAKALDAPVSIDAPKP